MTKAHPYHIEKKIDIALLEMDEIPLLKAPKKFTIKTLSKALAKSLDLPSLQIEIVKTKWRSFDNLLSSLGKNPETLSLTLDPLEGEIIIAIDNLNMKRFCHWIFTQSSHKRGLVSPLLQEGFYRFNLLKVLDNLEEMEEFPLSPKIAEICQLPQSGALALDIALTFENKSCFVRLLIPGNFRISWNNYFSKEPSLYHKELSSIYLPISIQVGYTKLSLESWNKIEKGDFLLLDRCTYDPKTHRGSVLMKMGLSPLFIGKISKNKLKLLDIADYYDEEIPMEENTVFSEDELFEEDFEKDESKEEILYAEKEKAKETTPIGKAPLTIQVEVGRCKITLEKLLQLQPGNFISLPNEASQLVTLRVGDKKIGSGELVQMGEVLGVRILDIAK